MKKFFVCILIGILMINMCTSVFAESRLLVREDIPILRDDSVEASGLKSLGILKGTGNGLELERNITRAEAVVLIFRIHPEVTGAVSILSPEFSDLDGHWAYKEVTAAKKMGIVDGVGNGKFEPDRIVTGREFTKMLLSAMGYKNVTIENAYSLGKESEIILNNFTKSVVEPNLALLRGDCVRLIWSALIGKTESGAMLYKKMIETGKYKEEDFDCLLGCGVPAYSENSTK